MMHETAVHALAISTDDDLLASGSQDGTIKVWKLNNGTCLKKIPRAHKASITSLYFAEDGLRVLSASKKIRLYGLRSGKKLK